MNENYKLITIISNFGSNTFIFESRNESSNDKISLFEVLELC